MSTQLHLPLTRHFEPFASRKRVFVSESEKMLKRNEETLASQPEI